MATMVAPIQLAAMSNCPSVSRSDWNCRFGRGLPDPHVSESPAGMHPRQRLPLGNSYPIEITHSDAAKILVQDVRVSPQAWAALRQREYAPTSRKIAFGKVKSFKPRNYENLLSDVQSQDNHCAYQYASLPTDNEEKCADPFVV